MFTDEEILTHIIEVTEQQPKATDFPSLPSDSVHVVTPFHPGGTTLLASLKRGNPAENFWRLRGWKDANHASLIYASSVYWAKPEYTPSSYTVFPEEEAPSRKKSKQDVNHYLKCESPSCARTSLSLPDTEKPCHTTRWLTQGRERFYTCRFEDIEGLSRIFSDGRTFFSIGG